LERFHVYDTSVGGGEGEKARTGERAKARKHERTKARTGECLFHVIASLRSNPESVHLDCFVPRNYVRGTEEFMSGGRRN